MTLLTQIIQATEAKAQNRIDIQKESEAVALANSKYPPIVRTFKYKKSGQL